LLKSDVFVENMQILMTVNYQAQHESSDTDIYKLKNYYNPSALAIFLKYTTHHVGAIK